MAVDFELKVTFDEWQEQQAGPVTHVDTVFGKIAVVTATPTWTPRTFIERFAFKQSAGTTTACFYVGTSWFGVTLTAL